ncbi:MAG: cache domain-containing protein [Anaeromyxobacteraceae bacterium]
MRSLSVELKLAAAILLVVIAAALASARLSGEVYERAVAATAMEKLRRAADLLGVHERAEVERLGSVLDVLANDESLVNAFLARDRDALLRLTQPVLATLRTRDRVTHWYFVQPDGSVFLRVHRPDLAGDRPPRLTLAKVMATGQPFSGKELGKTSFALRVVRPWRHDGRVIGYLELSEELSNFLSAMKARTGDDYGLVVSKRRLDHQAWVQALNGRPDTWNDRPDALVVDATSFDRGIVDFTGDIEALPDEGAFLGESQHEGRTLVRGVFPVHDVNQVHVGGLFVMRDDTGDRRAIRGGHLRAALVIVGVALAAALALGALVRALVFRRLRRLRREMESRATEAAVPDSRVIDLRSEDELGRLELLFDRMLFPLRRRDVVGREDRDR